MEVKNFDELIAITSDPVEIKARKLLIDLYKTAIEAVDPYHIIHQHLRYSSQEKMLFVNDDQYPVESRKVWIIGVGKAVGGMTVAIEEILDDLDYQGVICVPEGMKIKLNLKKILCLESTHPFPSEINELNTKKVLELINQISSDDLVIALISGGGSSMWVAPKSPISVQDLIILNQVLINSGMSIHEINLIRKHVSEIKGGKLARKISGEVITILLSDVVGDKLENIASGPLISDFSTLNEAKFLLKKYKLWEKGIPNSIKSVIKNGVNNEIAEKSKEKALVLNYVHSYLVGSNKIACKAILSQARKIGLNSLFLTDKLEGEARWIGKILARIYSGLMEENKAPLLIVSGGEPTVQVHGSGIGGRNQEVAAALLNEFLLNKSGLKFAFLSAGTDGIDGNSSYAGALIDNKTIDIYGEKRLIIDNYLAQNDTSSLFEKIGGTVLLTGPTGTNVMDIQLAII